jgi:hypothetical protein
MLTRRFQK